MKTLEAVAPADHSPWLFVLALQAYGAYDPGLKRFFAHLAETGDAGGIGAAMLTTAAELKFDRPRLTAVGAHLPHAWRANQGLALDDRRAHRRRISI